MHLQRALLLIAIVLGLTALAASLAPAPHHSRTARTPPRVTTPAPPPGAAPGPQQIAFHAPATGKRLPVRRVGVGEHVVIRVAAGTAGEVSIPSLGLTESVEPGTAATFDVLVSAGRADIMFAPPFGAPRAVGALLGA